MCWWRLSVVFLTITAQLCNCELDLEPGDPDPITCYTELSGSATAAECCKICDDPSGGGGGSAYSCNQAEGELLFQRVKHRKVNSEKYTKTQNKQASKCCSVKSLKAGKFEPFLCSLEIDKGAEYPGHLLCPEKDEDENLVCFPS